jgi:phage tail P2-like protein
MSSLLPQNATALETALAESVARISDVPTPNRDVWNPDKCPSDLLPWLAWAFSVDFWDAGWTDDQKRGAIKSAVAVQRYKGTIGAVKQALTSLGYGVAIQEWFNQLPEGAPYTFDVLLDSNQVGIDQAALAKILSYIDVTKNLRSHRGAVRPAVTTRGGPVVAGALCIGNEITVEFSAQQESFLDGTWTLDGNRRLDGLTE